MAKSDEKAKMDDKPISLAKKLQQVMLSAGTVDKRGYNSHYNYKYVLEADVADAVRTAFVDQGIIWLPDIKQITQSQVEMSTRDGKRMASGVLVEVLYTMINADDPSDRLVLTGSGYGMDIGDKALPKALTMAQKTTLMKLFLMGSDDDSENSATSIDNAGVRSEGASTAAQQSMPLTPTPTRSAAEWAQLYAAMPYVYEVPYLVSKNDQRIPAALKAAKAMFRGGTNRDKTPNGDTAADKKWYSKTEIPFLAQYRVSVDKKSEEQPAAPVRDTYDSYDDIPF